jgi:hypothetical protein
MSNFSAILTRSVTDKHDRRDHLSDTLMMRLQLLAQQEVVATLRFIAQMLG